jgi:hypothetical protein
MGLASSAGAFPLAVIDDSVRCADTGVSVTPIILPSSNGFDSGVSLPARPQLCPATSQPAFRFELSKCHVTMTSHRNAFRFGKPVTEARCEYTETEKLVKRNFSTTFSCTFKRDLVENFVEIAWEISRAHGLRTARIANDGKAEARCENPGLGSKLIFSNLLGSLDRC